MQTIQGGMVNLDLVQQELIAEKFNLKDGAGKQHAESKGNVQYKRLCV